VCVLCTTEHVLRTMLDGRMLYFTSAATIRQLLEVLLIWAINAEIALLLIIYCCSKLNGM
jgi:hypothetical protein